MKQTGGYFDSGCSLEVETPEPNGWQPIATAPKDGTGFLYFQKLPFGQKWIGSAIYHEGKCLHVQWSGEECDWTTINPTHWKPLPDDPWATS
ncbi:hypothetical protein SUAG_00033 [Sulfitobacter phage pCB2047-A]|uniref:hypothetical protein n=1 Tax=Sulfitobacter phage pCB2047-A TaxID=754045 RepID=UPI0002C084AE|nr:hypothetical protein SUAG_00033 [Sulfitobacter phage pCB2047-A]AGH30759.1 hypothetical protein SUAG_00033 [Sulfitobacter phage pCB2047-A]